MMLKIRFNLFFSLFLLISCQDCKGQTEKVFEYYKNIHSAESAILDNNLSSAIEHYSSAFSYSIHHNEDMENALQVELISPKINKKFFVFLLSTFLEGCDSNFFLTEVLSNSKRELVEERYDIDLSYYFSSIKPNYNVSLRKRVIEMHKRDQDIRRRCMKKSSDFYNIPECRELIIKNDSINYEELKKIYQLYGHISEFDVGYDYFYTINLVVLHNMQWGRFGLEKELLLKEVKAGYYPNRDFADLSDRLTTERHKGTYGGCDSYGEGIMIKVNKRLIVPVLYDSILQCINHNRAEIFLEDFKKYSKKKVFGLNNRDYYFGMNHNIGNFPDKMFNRILEGQRKAYRDIEVYSK